MTNDEELAAILASHEATHCTCGHAIGWGDIAWNNGGSAYGTPNCSVEIICEACLTSIAHIASWHPWIEDREDLLTVLDADWKYR